MAYNITKNPIIQQQPQGGIAYVAYPDAMPMSRGPPILRALEPITYLALKDDVEANCCSSKLHYDLVGQNKEILLKCYTEKKECCSCEGGLSLIVEDLQGTQIIRVEMVAPECCSATTEVEICAPPGSSIGSIVFKNRFFSSNTCEISSNLSGQKLFVHTEKNFFSPSGYHFINETSYSVGTVKIERRKFRLQMLQPDTDSVMKANIIGFMLVMDIYSKQAARQAQQQASN